MEDSNTMKKYEAPALAEVKVEIEDVIAASKTFGDNQPGDMAFEWPWLNK